MTLTPISTCQARNPEFCRYHGSAQRSGFERRTLARVATLQESLASTSNLDRRLALEHELQEAEVSYAATVEGELVLRERIRTADWADREKLSETLTEGLLLRERIEDLEEDGSTTFPASKLDEAIKRVDTANRRLARAGIEDRFTYTTEEFIENDSNGNMYSMVRFTISHPVIRENGWAFVAAVDKANDEGGLITRTMRGQELNGYRPETFECEHCGSHRRRKATYLLRNESGEIKQVGSNCLQPFLGMKPRSLWALGYNMEEDGNVIDRGLRTPGGPDSVVGTVDTLAMALALSDGGDNFRSTRQAEEQGGDSTAQRVRRYMFGNRVNNEPEIDFQPYVPQAQEIIATTHFESDSDYATNMRTLLAQEYIRPKHIGYVTSVIAADRRNRRATTVAAARVVSTGYIAPVGEKFTGESVKIKRIIPYTDDYGYSPKSGRMFIMTNASGQDIKWRTTSGDETVWNVSEGDEIIIERATVKAHDKYNDDDQTVVKNAKIAVAESN